MTGFFLTEGVRTEIRSQSPERLHNYNQLGIVTQQVVMITMAYCLMTQKIFLMMQNSCACKECSKWKQLLGTETKSKDFARSQSWFTRMGLFARGLATNTTRKRSLCLQQQGFKYSVKDLHESVTKVISFRFVFSTHADED